MVHRLRIISTWVWKYVPETPPPWSKGDESRAFLEFQHGDCLILRHKHAVHEENGAGCQNQPQGQGNLPPPPHGAENELGIETLAGPTAGP